MSQDKKPTLSEVLEKLRKTKPIIGGFRETGTVEKMTRKERRKMTSNLKKTNKKLTKLRKKGKKK